MPITQPVKWTEIKNKPTTVAGSGLADAATVTQATNAANPGTVAWFAAGTAPTGWIKANGAAVSRSTYAALFAAIGTTHGSGDGAATFNVPDLRGEFVRSLDDGRGVDSGRGIGTAQTDAMQGHRHTRRTDGSAERSYQRPSSGWGDTGGGALSALSDQTDTGNPVADGTNGAPRTGSETRPRNVALLACIKY